MSETDESKEAADAAMKALKKGKAFLNSIYRLGQYAHLLDDRAAFQFAGMHYEIGQALLGLKADAMLEARNEQE